MQNLNIGIIGAGYIAREHARSLRLVAPLFNTQINLTTVADINIEAAQSLAKEYQVAKATTDINSVLNDPNINTIFSCVPTKFHKQVVESCARTGKALFLEKPFAVSKTDAQEIHDLLTSSGLKHQVGFVLRYAPTYHALKKILAKNEVESPLRSVILRDDQCFPISGISHFTEWRSQKDLAGAGVLIEHGIHDLDLFEWLFGRITRVSARSKNHAGYEGIEDYLEARIEFQSGTTALMTHIWHDIPAHQSIRSFEIFHQKALTTLEKYDMSGISIRGQESLSTLERPDLYHMVKDDPLFRPIAHREDLLFVSDYYAIQDYWFLKNLIEGQSLSPTISDGLRAYQVAEACYDSARNDGAWRSV